MLTKGKEKLVTSSASSVPYACGASPHPAGDPINAGEHLAVYLAPSPLRRLIHGPVSPLGGPDRPRRLVEPGSVPRPGNAYRPRFRCEAGGQYTLFLSATASILTSSYPYEPSTVSNNSPVEAMKSRAMTSASPSTRELTLVFRSSHTTICAILPSCPSPVPASHPFHTLFRVTLQTTPRRGSFPAGEQPHRHQPPFGVLP